MDVKKFRLSRGLLGVILALLASVVPARAETPGFEVLYRFGTGGDGANPMGGVVRAGDGLLYGTTARGGGADLGTVFRVGSSGTESVAYVFHGPDGAQPLTVPVLGADGALYGTTVGAKGRDGIVYPGTVYRLTTGGALTTLHTFAPGGPFDPGKLTVGPDGAFYGATAYSETGGGPGTAFRVTADGGFTYIHTFGGNGEGRNTSNLTAGPDGALYGVTNSADGDTQRFFRISPAGEVTLLGGALTDFPGGLTLGGDGAFYAVDSSVNYVIYRLTAAGEATVIHHLRQFVEGDDVSTRLATGPDGALYGIAQDDGGSNKTTFFRCAYDGTVTVLRTLTPQEVEQPPGYLSLDADGFFYGVGVAGTDYYGIGTVCRLAADGSSLAALYRFQGPEGYGPAAGVARAADGTLYGTTAQGGANGTGTLFALSPAGSFATLHSFTNKEGTPGAVIVGQDGSVYGTTGLKLFRYRPGGAFEFLGDYGFAADRFGNLAQDKDGTLYGLREGKYVQGLIFKVTPNGVYSILHQFSNNDGFEPTDFTLGPDGVLHGTTGGDFEAGAVFSLTTGGAFSLAYSYSGAIKDQLLGDSPRDVLLAADGNLYGTQYKPGMTTSGQNTVFRLTPGGELSTVHRFLTPTDVYTVLDGLAEGPDGRLYGLGRQDKTDNARVYALTRDGAVTTLHLFPTEAADGDGPGGKLAFGPNGEVYGTAAQGGLSQGGVIYRVKAPTVPLLRSVVAAGADPRHGSVVLFIPEARAEDVVVRYTVKGSAVPGVDYTPLKGSARIKAGQTSRAIKIVVTGDLGGARKVLKIFFTPDPANYDLSAVKPVKITLAPGG